MTSFEDALRLILGSVAPLRVERVSLLDAAGRVLAEDVVAPGTCRRATTPPWTGLRCARPTAELVRSR